MAMAAAWTFEESLDGETMEGAAYWLASHGFLCLLPYETQVHQPRDGITHNGLGPTALITN